MARSRPGWFTLGLVLGVALATVAPVPGAATDMTLEYVARYNCQPGPDHLMNALVLPDGRVIVSGNQGLALLDLDALPPDGTQAYLYRLTGLNARNLYTADGRYIYVNLNRTGGGGSGGFAIVERVGDQLIHRGTVGEPDVLFEKMCLDGGYLYVAAHSSGLRVYSLSEPIAPVLVGSLTDGFVDAFATAIDGDILYVADGAGGLKVVDVSDRTDPVLLDGEDLESAVGTAEAVRVRDGHVYVAAGGVGVAFYTGGDPGQRALHPVNGAAEDMCWAGDFLCVSDFSGVHVFEVLAGGGLERVAGETAQRRWENGNARLRLCEGVGATTDGRILCADWNYMDVYRLLPAASGTQADLNASVQRIRFAPEGGPTTATLTNNGAAPLTISSVVTSSGFDCDYVGGTLLVGESVECEISYGGGGANANGAVGFYSDDPDENPLPIQLFGNTPYLDPGEMATDFTLPAWEKDDQGDWAMSTFTLSDHVGKIVWFQVYGSW